MPDSPGRMRGTAMDVGLGETSPTVIVVSSTIVS
jgi:hypothetical protein